MLRNFIFALMLVSATLALPLSAQARGFGGGGGGRSMGGGGFGGGGRPGGGFSGGGFSGGARPGGNFGGGPNFGGGNFGGGANFGGGNFRSNEFGGGNFGGGANFGGGNFDRGLSGGMPAQNLGSYGRGEFGGNFQGNRDFGAGNFGGGNFAGTSRDSFGDRFQNSAAPNRSQLNNFLGLPSDEGLGSNFDVNHGTVEGPRGGTATGTTITGPGGNTVGRGAAEGPNGGVVAGRGFEGAGGAKGGQAIGVGPGGRVAGGAAVRGPEGYGGGRGFVAGPNGVAAGFSRVTPSGRYTAAAAVRTNFNGWGMYGGAWYRNYPGAWFCAGWAANAAWNAATWDSMGAWMSYYPTNPVYYNYGNNVVYQDDSVYVDGQNVGTADQYYDQASQLASTGAMAEAPSDGDWLPLGVFSLTKVDTPTSNLVLQLAVNKAGIIRGNYTDNTTKKTEVVQGSVDKETQRVAFTVGDNTTTVVETGLYNLTKDEAPALMHFGKDKTEQWLLVRLNPDEQQK